ncbi:hypothetical protein HK101_004489, partial [Irineochytrium annulatum]
MAEASFYPSPSLPTLSMPTFQPVTPTIPAAGGPGPSTPDRVGISSLSGPRVLLLGSTFIVALDALLFPLATLQTIMMSDRSTSPTTASAQHHRPLKPTPSPGVLRLTLHLLRTEGPLRLWQGAPTAVLGSLPGQACYYATYETSRELLSTLPHAGAHGFIAGATAELVAGMFYVPTDVITQRLQTQSRGALSFTHNCRLHSGASGVIREIWRTEGVRG